MQPLTLSSFNLRYAGSRDDVGDRTWESRRGACVNVIRAWSKRDAPLALVCFQECLRRQYDDLLWLLNETEHSEAWVGVFAGRDDGKDSGEATAVIWRKDWLFCEKAMTFWLSDTPDVPGSKAPSTSLPRVCTGCIFKDTRKGAAEDSRFVVMNAHLDHENPRGRAFGIHVMLGDKGLKRILAGAAGAVRAVIMCGDFNATPSEEEVHGQLKRAGFVDVAATVTSLVHQNTFHNFTGNSNWGDSNRIDCIYASSSMAGAGALHIDSVTVDTGRYSGAPLPSPAAAVAGSHGGGITAAGVWPSDHFPLMSTLRF